MNSTIREWAEALSHLERKVNISREAAETVLQVLYDAMYMSEEQLRYMDYTVSMTMEFVKRNKAHIHTCPAENATWQVYDATAAEEMTNRAQGAADVADFLGLTPEEASAATELGGRIIGFTPKQKAYYLFVCAEMIEDESWAIKEEYNAKE